MKKLKLPNHKVKQQKTVLTVAIFIILCIYFISLMIPIVWAIYSSFNDKFAYAAYYVRRMAFPTKLTFDNFRVALTKYSFTATTTQLQYNFFEMIGFSLIYTIGCAFFFTLTPCLVAYCAARFKFRFSKVLYAFVIVTMSLPIVGSMPSEIRMLKAISDNVPIIGQYIGYDTFPGMFILRMNFLSINFLIFYAQFSMIPMTYSEAAKVDGASNFRIMTTVILPQAIPTITTVFLLSFIAFWNDYQIPLVYLPSYPTVSEGLFTFISGESAINYTPIKMAGFIGLTVPLVTVFAILNKYLRLNVATGGIKG